MRKLLLSGTKNNQQGVALIQVLLISAIISILGIRFSYTAREQVETAYTFEQRIKATQLLKSVQSKIIFTLLTEDNFQQGNQAVPDSQPWNFYGQPFFLDPYTKVSIQDNNGLLTLQNIKDPMWLKLLELLKVENEQALEILGQLKDWQDKDNNLWAQGNSEPVALANGKLYRNQPIQLPQEVDWFFDDYPMQLNIIKQVSSHYPRGVFNPMNAPDQLLRILFDSALAEQLILDRNQNTLTKQQMINALGENMDSETITFFNSLALRIIVQVSVGDVLLQETLEVKIQPWDVPEVLILARY